MDRRIRTVRAIEVLDSRGNPTLRVAVTLDDGSRGSASVPSGASTGSNEALELRDKDPKRFGGKGVLTAINNIHATIEPALVGHNPATQAVIDHTLLELDGTADKSKLGANAILGVSMAVARAAAASSQLPLYEYLGGIQAQRLPMPMMNVINGGEHADNALDFQEFMIVPIGAERFSEAVRYGAETFHALKALLKRRGLSTAVGDEGGFAPTLGSNEAACDLLVEAIGSAGLEPGRDVAIALDPAASSFRSDDRYDLRKSGAGEKSTDDMIALYGHWLDRYPIVSIEDGLAEDDWAGFTKMTSAFADRVQVVGDDLYVTNTRFIERGIREEASTAVLVKLNQIGTVTETIEAIRMCRKAGWNTVVSHRSGETEDTFIADFAVAMGCGQIKTGSLSRGERTAKYNRLLEIEDELGGRAEFSNPFSR